MILTNRTAGAPKATNGERYAGRLAGGVAVRGVGLQAHHPE